MMDNDNDNESNCDINNNKSYDEVYNGLMEVFDL